MVSWLFQEDADEREREHAQISILSKSLLAYTYVFTICINTEQTISFV